MVAALQVPLLFNTITATCGVVIVLHLEAPLGADMPLGHMNALGSASRFSDVWIMERLKTPLCQCWLG